MPQFSITHTRFRRFRFVLFGIVPLVIGLFLGNLWAVRGVLTSDRGQVNISKVIDFYTKTRSSEVSFDQFWNIWDLVKAKHIDANIQDTTLFYGAIQGMVASLGDPYSVYFPPAKAEEFTKDLAGEFDGIGAEIGIRNNQLVVIAPLPSSPAEKAGLKSGDKILAIDGVETYEMSVEDAVFKIRGKKGTTVVLVMTRNGAEQAEEIPIVRDTITVPTVRFEMKKNDIAYLRVGFFNEDTGEDFDDAVRALLLKNPRGIILDVRSNPGGLLETSIDVASEWIKDGIVVTEEFRDTRQNRVHQTRGKHRFIGIPTVVLVDGGTASGAEIVAGALQDHGVAKVLGSKTFGKGSVQDFEPLPDGSALKLTVAEWFTPSHKQIDKTGIIPDILLDIQFATSSANGTPLEQPFDKGIEKAMEFLANRP